MTETGSGLSVAPENADEFIAAIGSLIDDQARREAMGVRGRAFVEAWASPAGVAASYVELFAELGARASQPARPDSVMRRG